MHEDYFPLTIGRLLLSLKKRNFTIFSSLLDRSREEVCLILFSLIRQAVIIVA